MNSSTCFSNGAVRLECKRLHPDAKIPSRSRKTDAGLDLYSLHDLTVMPGKTANVSTGVILVAPAGWYLAVVGRSGLIVKGVAPHIGTVDSGYTGELMVVLFNSSDQPYHVSKGDRIAQAILTHIPDFAVDEVEEISSNYNIRGTNGFGSSGR